MAEGPDWWGLNGERTVIRDVLHIDLLKPFACQRVIDRTFNIGFPI